MSQKQIIILLGFAIFVTILLLLMGFVFTSQDKEEVVDNEPVVEETEPVDNESGIPEFSEDVEEDAEATEPERVTEKEGSKTGEREGGYTVVVSSDGYNPDVLTIDRGTIVSLKLRSEGGKYDFYIPKLGNYLVAEDGEEGQLSFRVSGAGTYRIECRDYCPSSGKIYGKLVVKSK